MARQLLTETLVLTTIGGLLGLAVGYWSLGGLSSLGLAELPRGHEIRMGSSLASLSAWRSRKDC